MLYTQSGSSQICRCTWDKKLRHLGQFSQDYRRLFGERPSETLAAKAHGLASFGNHSTVPV